MEELHSCINGLNSSKDLFPSKHLKRFYHLLSQISIDNISDTDSVLLRIYDLIKTKNIRKDLMFISLLANRDTNVVLKFIDYEKLLIKLDLTDSALLYDYCLFTNKHWILDIVQNDTSLNDVFTQNTLSIFSHLQLIHRTNKLDINLEKICDSLAKTRPSSNEFMNEYIHHLNRVLDVVQLCKKYLDLENNSLVSEIYYYASNNSLLSVFSKFLDLQSFNVCHDVLLKLNKHNATVESEVLTGFLVINTVLHCLDHCKIDAIDNDRDEISERIQETELKLISMTNHTLQIELLENIFALLFLQAQHLSTSDESTNFYCSEKEVRLILMLLKATTDEIKRKNLLDRKTEEYRRFTKLNKSVTDGLWRLELITDSNISEKIRHNIISYLLAPPEALIHLSLKQNNFNKADQVIQIFNLQDSEIASKIKYNTNFLNLKQVLRKTFKMQQIKKENSEINMEVQSIENVVEDFFKSNTNSDEAYILSNLIDLFVTLPNNLTECNEWLKIISAYSSINSESQCFKFYKNISEVFAEVNNRYSLSVKDILCDIDFDLNTEQYKMKEFFFYQLHHLCDIFCKQISYSNDGIFNAKHPIHKTFIKLHQLIFNHNEYDGKDHIKYLQRLFNYLKGLSKVLYIEQNNSEIVSHNKNTSFFELLNVGRSEILEKLIFEKNLDISDFEQLFLKLKLDLVYHVSAIFFPNISLATTKDHLLERKAIRAPNSRIILYIQKRNWLLAYILKEIYKSDEFKLDLSEVRVKTFINYLELPSVQQLKPLYDKNPVITALHHAVNLPRVVSYINEHTVEREDFDHPNFLLASQTSTGSLETGEEIFEGGLRITDWKHLFDIIDNLPQKDLMSNEELIKLHDLVLMELVGDCFEVDYFKYAQLIINNKLRHQCILDNYTTWPGDFCVNIFKSELSSFSTIDEECKEKFKEWCEKIDICEKIKKILSKSSWFEVLLLCNEKPSEILHSLLNTIQIDLLLQFLSTFQVDSEMLEEIDENYLVELFDSSTNYFKIEDLLKQLSREHLTTICCNSLTVLKKLEHLNFIVDFMARFNLPEDDKFLKNIKISIKIMSCFTATEQEHLWCLISEPSAIIEILIMNTKLEKLGEVLEKVIPCIETCEFDESRLSIEKIDEILRSYAEKSLEFRVVLHPESKFVKSPESSKLLQSLDSLNFVSYTKYFVMPETVPKKSEWVENYEVTECMCCMQTTFSMFNRRHHCRRCGRVICGACSLKRMQVPTYEDILVRVCLDCYEQSHADGAGTSSSKSEMSTRSVGYDHWLLTNDEAHNQIVREEFSYEYAPSVSLCLAILKYHSKTEEYPKFLLDQCDGMLRILQPVHSNSTQEIDYLLVIKMLKSLAIAAKMVSAQCMLQWGTSLADRILSQADILGLLAERDCLHLLPTSSIPNQVCNIDGNTLRRLRDKLLEREQWNLALEVSTKAGLDNTGVFTAWGKSYLKAGSLQKAREKFQRCFDKIAHYETSTELSSSFSSMQLSHYRTKTLSQLPENRPMKNPPLLNEILNILETNPTVIDPRILKEAKKSTLGSSTCSINSSVTASVHNDPAIFILNKLKNLNYVVAGNYDAYSDSTDSVSILSVSKPYLEPLFYEECLYYLTKYGSHMSVLEFYIRRGRFYECLKYMLEHHLSSDCFVEIYMLCLKENYVNAIHEAMSKIDSTLDIWKNYLKHICRHLEQQSNLNSLYQLQQFMGDFVRAALTCIKFYKDDASTYTELTARVDYLHEAQEHLQQELEQEQWVEVASVRKSTSDDQESFEAKGIANPSLVMKIDSKNIDKHINTISRQIEVAKFLAECESSATPVLQILPEILPFINEDASTDEIKRIKIPTLFGSYYERVQLAVLTIVCGNNVADGFGIAFRIIHDHNLNPVKVYCQAGKQLAKSQKYTAIAQLVSCIKSSGVNNSAVTDMTDEMLILVIQTLTKANSSGPQLDSLIKLITDRAAKISAYIESKQLKTAYLLAVKHKRMGDIRRILREAEFLNQPNIKALCQKILHSHSHYPSHSKD